jgi:glycosyltransferase involved in cell wall biosynthesis
MDVYQLNSTLAFGDAITNHTLEMDKVLRKWGFDTQIFAETIDSKNLQSGIKLDKNYKKYMPSKDDLLIYHYSVYCENINLYKDSNNLKIFEYHNITPPKYFREYDDNLGLICKRGREELGNLTICTLSIGDSEYNRQELVENGFKEETSDVLPIFLHYNDYDSVELNENLYKKFYDGFVNILFVGRIAPNKKIEDLIKTFYFYKKINPRSRLFIVGTRFLNYYDKELTDFVNALRVDGVYFTDKVSLSDLKTYYKLADIFLCMSEHEGFCVPLIESMYFKIPIIAYNSTAIPYTLENSGVLINKKNYLEIAELINLIIEDEKLKSRIITNQNERLNYFDRTNVEKKLKTIIERVVS